MGRHIVNKQRQDYGRSTIAMSAYNAIATNGGSARKEIIFDILLRVQHPTLDIKLLESALERLLELNYIHESNGIYSIYDSQRRMIVARDLSTIYVDVLGIPRGGWDRWMIRDSKGLIPAEEAIRGI